jgi:prepilin-type N-terminal cleavage/methylation domain-containing protein
MKIALRRSAFTLVEVLVVIVILGVLVALSVPMLSQTREASRELKCRSNLRTMGQFVHVYAGDFRDSMPTWIDDLSMIAPDRARWSGFALQWATTIPREPWRLYTGLTLSSPEFHCPANQIDWPSLAPSFGTDYVLSASLYAEVSYLDPSVPSEDWGNRLGGKVQTLATVMFPSRKVGLFEMDVWHEWSGTYAIGQDLSTLEYYGAEGPGSVWAMDGHVEARHARDARETVFRYPTWPAGAFLMTAKGVAGLDL